MNDVSAIDEDIDGLSGFLVEACERTLGREAFTLALTGSAVLGDFKIDRSDLDFVAILRGADTGRIDFRPLNAALGRGPKRRFDGLFLSERTFAAGPDHIERAPLALMNGRLARSLSSGQMNPITWATIAQTSVVVAGALPTEVNWPDHRRLDLWIKANTRSYWSKLRRRSASPLSPWAGAALSTRFCAWAVLGLARMIVTQRTGDIVSKSHAGAFALNELHPKWRILIEEAIAHRERRRPAMNPVRRRAMTLDFMADAIDQIQSAAAAN